MAVVDAHVLDRPAFPAAPSGGLGACGTFACRSVKSWKEKKIRD